MFENKYDLKTRKLIEKAEQDIVKLQEQQNKQEAKLEKMRMDFSVLQSNGNREKIERMENDIKAHEKS